MFVCWWHKYRRADNSRPVSFTVSAWEWSMLRTCLVCREKQERERETSKRHVGEAHSILITAILLLQRLSCYWGKIVSLRMLTNLRLADLRLTTAQQISTGQNLPSDLYCYADGNVKIHSVVYQMLWNSDLLGHWRLFMNGTWTHPFGTPTWRTIL
jgi:hypothetical protein